MSHIASLTGSRSEAVERVLRRLVGDSPTFSIRAYDGTTLGPPDAETHVEITSPQFFARVLRGRASELAFVDALLAGEVVIEGDVYGLFGLRDHIGRLTINRTLVEDAAEILEVRSVGDVVEFMRLARPKLSKRSRGRPHSPERDARAIAWHYDISTAFYELFLDASLTYSCAVFDSDHDSLEVAQANKHDLVCRKLGLRPGMRLLDVGCGWGAMAIHAARHYGVRVVGITLSAEQQARARARAEEAGLGDLVEFRLQDYRSITDGPFDAIASIGMFEHVGKAKADLYFQALLDLLVPEGRLLNHAINRSVPRRRTRVDPRSLIGALVFPDGELLEAGQIVTAMHGNGFEVRHVESIREHYARTLRIWVARLESNWDLACQEAPPGVAEIWRLYLAGSALAFESNEVTVTQILATKTDRGFAGMALRPDW